MSPVPDWLLEAAETRQKMAGLGSGKETWRQVQQAKAQEFAKFASRRLEEMAEAGLFGALSGVRAEVDDSVAAQGTAVLFKAKTPSGFYRKASIAVEKEDAVAGEEAFWKKLAFEVLAIDAECSKWLPAPGALSLVEERALQEAAGGAEAPWATRRKPKGL